MPSSRRPRAPAPARVPAPTRQCQALLADEETRCSSHTQRRAKYCAAHGREYGQLTGAYKGASERVDALEPEIRQTRTSVGTLSTVAAVEGAVALANRYLDALGEEIDGRETHHKRFFQEVDENHEKWLKRRRGEQQGAVRLLERLRRRREEVVAAEEAARRSEERRKDIEEAQRRHTAEAQRRAIEEAQRRVALEARWRAMEEARLAAVADAHRKAAQVRSILGERTNVATSTRSPRSAAPNPVGVRVAERVPPVYWPSVVPPSRLPPPQHPSAQPQLQPPRLGQHPSVPQSTRETQPLLRPAGTTRAVNSWLVDIESQSRNAAQLRRGRVHPTGLHVRNEESADSGCGCAKTLFWIVLFFVFCHLVVVGYSWQGYRWVV